MLLKLVKEMNEISFFNSHVVSQTLFSSFFFKKAAFSSSFIKLRQIPEEYDMAFQPFLLCFPW